MGLSITGGNMYLGVWASFHVGLSGKDWEIAPEATCSHSGTQSMAYIQKQGNSWWIIFKPVKFLLDLSDWTELITLEIFLHKGTEDSLFIKKKNNR